MPAPAATRSATAAAPSVVHRQPRGARPGHDEVGGQLTRFRPPAAEARLQPAQLSGHVAQSLPAIVRPFGKARVDQGVQAGRNDGNQRRYARGLVAQNRAHHLDGRLALERLQARHHLEEHRAEREDVGAGVDLAPLELLGRHVVEGSHHRALSRQGRALGLGCRRPVLLHDGPGQAEVEQMSARARQDDVAGLQVAVDDAGPMGGREGFGDLDAVLQRVCDR